MPIIKQIASTEQLAGLSETGGVEQLGKDEFVFHAPDGHWVVLDDNGTLAGRCSIWWQAVPEVPQERPGIIGHFAARDAESASSLLRHCCQLLTERGCTLAIGPMDGTTWRRYRFITKRGTEHSFFLEPDNPDEYPLYFEKAGFTPYARYFSNLDPDLGWQVPETLQHRLEQRGIRIRQLNPADYSGELEKIYTISTASFSNNFLYSPISRDEFLAMYAKVRCAVQPELVLFAEYQQTPVGFVFAIGDLLNAHQGRATDTVIIKSLAVLPSWNGKGVGPLLMSRATANARSLGYLRGIHALMHEDNRSRDLSGHHGTVMREYALYSRSLR